MPLARSLVVLGTTILAVSVSAQPTVNFDGRMINIADNASHWGANPPRLRLKDQPRQTIRDIKGRAAPSRSTGATNNGRLINGWQIPPVGAGYRSIRASRKRFYGTDKMVKGIVWLGSYLKGLDSKTPDLAVGDISQRGGGKISQHASHQNGRDVDLNYFWTDTAGKPVFAADMVSLRVGRTSNYGNKKVTFDLGRNWNLIQGLLKNPHMKVQRIFIDSSMRTALLNYARKKKVSGSLRNRASSVMMHWKNHSNHMHVRIEN